MKPFKKSGPGFVAMLLMVLVMAATLSSCSKYGDRREELLSHVNDKAIAVMTLNPSVFIESAGGKTDKDEITMPPVVEKLMKDLLSKRQRRSVSSLAEVRGLNLKSAVLAVYNSDYSSVGDGIQPVFLCSVTDADEFAKWLEDRNLYEDKEGDYRCFSGKGIDAVVVICDDVAYILPFVDDTGDAADMVKDMERDSRSRRLASWKSDYLSDSDKAASALVFLEEISERDIAEFYNNKVVNDDANVLAFELKLDGLHLTAAMNILDRDGKPADIVSESALAPLNPSVAELYATGFDFFSAMSLQGSLMEGIKDEVMKDISRDLVKSLFGEDINKYDIYSYDTYWGYMNYSNPMRDSLRSLASSPDFIRPMKKISAVSLGMGVKKDADLSFRNPEKMFEMFNLGLSAAFDDEKAAAAYYKAWHDMKLPGMNSGKDCISFKPHELLGAELYMTRRSDNVMLSTEKEGVKGGRRLPCDIDDAVAFAAMELPKDGAVMKALPVKLGFGVTVWGYATRHSALIDLTLTGTEGGLLLNILELCQKFSTYASGDMADDYEMVDDEDFVEVEEVEVVEEVAADTAWVARE
ncbi:MAG: hypothetical protein K2F74_01965 [Muribaculaceae bacterium]|nr:hypothetical protein [Muribaculaceae bacterium]